MSKTLEFAVDVLAVQRLTRLVVEDTIFDGPREWVVMNGPDKLVELVTCPHCVSIYAGAAAVSLRRVAPRLWAPLASALALSAVTSLKTEAFATFGGHEH